MQFDRYPWLGPKQPAQTQPKPFDRYAWLTQPIKYGPPKSV